MLEATLIRSPKVSSSSKNTAIRNAVKATASLFFSEHPSEQSGDHLELVTLAKQMSRHLEMDSEESSSHLAFESFEHLMRMAISSSGNTFSSLNLALQGFEQLKAGPAADQLSEKCKTNIQMIRRAKSFKLAYTSTALPLLNMRKLLEPYAFPETPGAWFKARASKTMQEQVKLARTKYQSSSLDS